MLFCKRSNIEYRANKSSRPEPEDDARFSNFTTFASISRWRVGLRKRESFFCTQIRPRLFTGFKNGTAEREREREVFILSHTKDNLEYVEMQGNYF